MAQRDDRETKLERARSHMSVTAKKLTAVLGPTDAAGVLMGAAVGVLSEAFGQDKAVEYLREIANEIEHDPGIDRGGHA